MHCEGVLKFHLGPCAIISEAVQIYGNSFLQEPVLDILISNISITDLFIFSG